MIDLTPQALIQDAIVVIVVMMSASLHEVAHGWVAYKCGDNTAKAMGRLTLNPLAHIDLFGSIILPFLMMLLGGPVFGYAKLPEMYGKKLPESLPIWRDIHQQQRRAH